LEDLAVDLKDKLPLDYTHEKYAMQFDDGVLYIMERKDAEKAVVEELPDFIKVLIHSLGEGNVVEHHIDDKPQTSETVH
jgi:fatty acid-binding protein DegV